MSPHPKLPAYISQVSATVTVHKQRQFIDYQATFRSIHIPLQRTFANRTFQW